MGIMTRLDEQRASYQLLGPPRDPAIAQWFGGSSNSASGMSVTPDSAMRNTVVYRCVALLSQTYASLPLEVYREDADGSKTPDKKHPNYRLLRYQPNKWQTSFEWREMMAGHFALRGKCYSEIISSGGSGISQLVPLHPDRVRAFRVPGGGIAFEYSPLDGPARIILQDEMHYQHLLASDDGFEIKPLSPIAASREAIGLALATEEHGARLFSNGARPGGLLKMAGHLKDDEARKQFLLSWRDAHAGSRNAYKTALLEDGMEWQQLGMTSEDAQYVDVRKHQIGELCRPFGVPPHKVFDLDRSTNNNIEHQGIEFVTDTIRPGAVRWEQAMKRDLFYGDSARTHCAEFDLDALMRGDSAARSTYFASGLQNGWLNRNEVRVDEGRNRSTAQGMDDYTIQTNMAMIQFLQALGAITKQQGQQQSGAANA